MTRAAWAALLMECVAPTMCGVEQTGRPTFCRVPVREFQQRTAAMAAGGSHRASVSFIHAHRAIDPGSRDRVGPGGESTASNPLAELDAFDSTRFGQRRVKRGEAVYHAGDRFSAIYVVRSGF